MVVWYKVGQDDARCGGVQVTYTGSVILSKSDASLQPSNIVMSAPSVLCDVISVATELMVNLRTETPAP
jgi:hypothetical protein